MPPVSVLLSRRPSKGKEVDAVDLSGNDPQEGFDGWAEAVYTSDGIGYRISACRDADIPYYSPNWPYYDSAKEIVLSLFADPE